MKTSEKVEKEWATKRKPCYKQCADLKKAQVKAPKNAAAKQAYEDACGGDKCKSFSVPYTFEDGANKALTNLQKCYYGDIECF